jgi:rhodanese-related sulfurtransferase
MSTVEEISPEEASRRLADFHPVDVRAEHEFRGPLGHIEGSALVPLPELETRAALLPVDRPFLMVCRSGARSARACLVVERLGRGPALNLQGGMIAWNHAGLPRVPFEPRSTSELLESVVRWAQQVGAFPPEAADAFVADRLEATGSTRAEPSSSALEQILADVEASLAESEPPPDLGLSLAAFRRALALR